jgi:hypothetical protein
MKLRKVVVVGWMTLDGVVQAQGDRDEDRDGGFAHGGWHLRYFDDTSQQWVVQGCAEAGGFLFGRRTYEMRPYRSPRVVSRVEGSR